MEMTTLEQANVIRQRLLAGEDVSREELTAALTFLRTSRAAAPAAKATKEPKAGAAPKMSLLDMLKKLEEPK